MLTLIAVHSLSGEGHNDVYTAISEQLALAGTIGSAVQLLLQLFVIFALHNSSAPKEPRVLSLLSLNKRTLNDDMCSSSETWRVGAAEVASVRHANHFMMSAVAPAAGSPYFN